MLIAFRVHLTEQRYCRAAECEEPREGLDLLRASAEGFQTTFISRNSLCAIDFGCNFMMLLLSSLLMLINKSYWIMAAGGLGSALAVMNTLCFPVNEEHQT